jgi:hypothetical protein
VYHNSSVGVNSSGHRDEDRGTIAEQREGYKWNGRDPFRQDEVSKAGGVDRKRGKDFPRNQRPSRHCGQDQGSGEGERGHTHRNGGSGELAEQEERATCSTRTPCRLPSVSIPHTHWCSSNSGKQFVGLFWVLLIANRNVQFVEGGFSDERGRGLRLTHDKTGRFSFH